MTRIGIICPGQMGDVAESTGLFKYADELWPGEREIHWFVQERFQKALLHNPHVIIHASDKPTPKFVEEAQKAIFDMKLKPAYATAPWLNMAAVWNTPLPMIPPRVLDLDLKGRPWLPQVWITEEERREVAEWIEAEAGGQALRVMIETASFSQQGELSTAQVRELRDALPEALFFCTSFGAADDLQVEGVDAKGLDHFGFRQLTEVYNYMDLWVGVPSGSASVTCAERCVSRPRFELIERSRCPIKDGVPDWGTSSMRPCSVHYIWEKVLDSVRESAHNVVESIRTHRRQAKEWRRSKPYVV